MSLVTWFLMKSMIQSMKKKWLKSCLFRNLWQKHNIISREKSFFGSQKIISYLFKMLCSTFVHRKKDEKSFQVSLQLLSFLSHQQFFFQLFIFWREQRKYERKESREYSEDPRIIKILLFDSFSPSTFSSSTFCVAFYTLGIALHAKKTREKRFFLEKVRVKVICIFCVPFSSSLQPSTTSSSSFEL